MNKYSKIKIVDHRMFVTCQADLKRFGHLENNVYD